MLLDLVVIKYNVIINIVFGELVTQLFLRKKNLNLILEVIHLKCSPTLSKNLDVSLSTQRLVSRCVQMV